MDGIEGYFKSIWNANDNNFYQGAHFINGKWEPNKKDFAVDCQTWAIAVLGPELIDRWFGKGSALKMWQKTKELSAYKKDGKLCGVGFTSEHDRLTVEWSAGAILACRILADYYKDNSILDDAQSMRRGIDEFKFETEAGKAAYSYSSRRAPIPFGWNSHSPEVLSTASTSWVVMLEKDFNPFILGGKAVTIEAKQKRAAAVSPKFRLQTSSTRKSSLPSAQGENSLLTSSVAGGGRVLITGGAGYFGSELARCLLAKGLNVWVIDDESTGHRQAVPKEIVEQGRYIKGNVCDSALLTRIISSNYIDTVYHLAAKTLMGDSVETPALYYYTNVIGTLSVAEAIRRAQEEQNRKIILLNVSTCGVFDDSAEEVAKGVGFTEKTSVRPTAPYTETKLLAEQILEEYRRKGILEYASVRPFNIVGASMDGKYGEDTGHATHLITVIGKRILDRSTMASFGNDWPTATVPAEAKLTLEEYRILGINEPDGSCIREYVWVVEMCELAYQIVGYLRKNAGSDVDRVFLGCTGVPLSTLKVIKAAYDEAIKLGMISHPLKTVIAGRRPGDDAIKMGDRKQNEEKLGFTPQAPLGIVLSTHLKFIRSQPKGYGDDKISYRDLSEADSLSLLIPRLEAADLSGTLKQKILFRLMTDLVISGVNCKGNDSDPKVIRRKTIVSDLQVTRGNILRDYSLDAAVNNAALLDAFMKTVEIADKKEALVLAASLENISTDFPTYWSLLKTFAGVSGNVADIHKLQTSFTRKTPAQGENSLKEKLHHL